jgi:hypothetical protein
VKLKSAILAAETLSEDKNAPITSASKNVSSGGGLDRIFDIGPPFVCDMHCKASADMRQYNKI